MLYKKYDGVIQLKRNHFRSALNISSVFVTSFICLLMGSVSVYSPIALAEDTIEPPKTIDMDIQFKAELWGMPENPDFSKGPCLPEVLADADAHVGSVQLTLKPRPPFFDSEYTGTWDSYRASKYLKLPEGFEIVAEVKVTYKVEAAEYVVEYSSKVTHGKTRYRAEVSNFTVKSLRDLRALSLKSSTPMVIDGKLVHYAQYSFEVKFTDKNPIPH